MTINQAWVTAYSSAFLRDVHQLLAWGYEGAQEMIATCTRPQDAQEEAITGLIVDSMRKRLPDMSTKAGFDRYQVHEDRPVQDGRRTGRRRRKIDILVQTNLTDNHVDFIIEAKRLCARGFPIGEYTGRNGMQRFVRGEYGADCPMACMVGYLQSHDAARWREHLERSLDSRQPELRTSSGPAPIKIVDEIPNEWITEHDRDGGRCIRLYHIFLDCRQRVPLQN